MFLHLVPLYLITTSIALKLLKNVNDEGQGHVIHVIFTPGKELSEEFIKKEIYDKFESLVKLYIEPSQDNPRIVSPLGIAEGSADIKVIVSVLKEQLERKLLA
jgi:hypothetical protein